MLFKEDEAEVTPLAVKTAVLAAVAVQVLEQVADNYHKAIVVVAVLVLVTLAVAVAVHQVAVAVQPTLLLVTAVLEQQTQSLVHQ